MEVEICNRNEIKKVLFLQKEFFKENCCNGICLDTIEDLEKRIIFIVKHENKIIGYAFGDFNIENKDKSYVKKNQKSLVLKKYIFLKTLETKVMGSILLTI